MPSVSHGRLAVRRSTRLIGDLLDAGPLVPWRVDPHCPEEGFAVLIEGAEGVTLRPLDPVPLLAGPDAPHPAALPELFEAFDHARVGDRVPFTVIPGVVEVERVQDLGDHVLGPAAHAGLEASRAQAVVPERGDAIGA